MSALKNVARAALPRDRLLALGAESLKTEELLAILFRTGSQGVDVLSMSRELLEKYGSLKNLSRASAAELSPKRNSRAEGGGVKGLGETKAVTLLAALELGRRARDEEDALDDVESRLSSWARRLEYEEREFIVAIYLDRKNRPVADDLLSYGGPNGAVLDAPHLLRRAVRLDARSLVLLHNHPGGSLRPSKDDLKLTAQIESRLRVLDINFYGHYITAAGRLQLITDEMRRSEESLLSAAQTNKF